MKRKLFFLIDRLEIKRSERISVTILLISILILNAVWSFSEPALNDDQQYYAELERIFDERSRKKNLEHQAIMARYEPIVPNVLPESTVQDTVPDTLQTDPEDGQISNGRKTLININNATSENLQELPGIGPSYAQRILEWIEKNGEFTSKEQLLEIRGIGEKRLDNIKDLIEL